jgi:hypothetical protein
MLLSGFFHPKVPAPRFAPGLFLALLAVFAILGQDKPVVGLVGLGTTMLVAGILVILNRKRIWETYRKQYKKTRGLALWLTGPAEIWYTVNVWVLWPSIVLLGVFCLYAAYSLA